MEQTIAIRNMNDLERKALHDHRSPFIKATDIYFKPKSFEKEGKIYERLGIKPFKKVIRGTIGKMLKDNPYLKEGADSYFIEKNGKKDISHYESWARLNEAIHAPGIVLAGKYLASGIAEGDVGISIASSIVFLMNVYLTMLQRYNRGRAYRILEKRDER